MGFQGRFYNPIPLIILCLTVLSCRHIPQEQDVPVVSVETEQETNNAPAEPLLQKDIFSQIEPETLEDEIPQGVNQRLQMRNRFSRRLDIPASLNNVSVFALDKDDLWVGSWSGGVFRYSIPLEEWEVIKEPVESLTVNSTYAISVETDRVWLTGYNWFSYYQKSSSQIRSYRQSIPGRIRDFIIWQDHSYMGTAGGGIYRYENYSGKWEPYPPMEKAGWQINQLVLSDKGFWICTADRGLYFWNGRQLSNEISGFPGLNVTTVEEWNNSLWIGTYGQGLIQLSEEERYIYSEQNSQLTDDWILCSLKTEDYLFLGTLGGGIQYFNRNGDYAILTLQEGLYSMDIAALTWYNQSLYVGTLGGGISVIDEEILQYQLQNRL